jgi:hypothetical protein
VKEFKRNSQHLERYQDEESLKKSLETLQQMMKGFEPVKCKNQESYLYLTLTERAAVEYGYQ